MFNCSVIGSSTLLSSSFILLSSSSSTILALKIERKKEIMHIQRRDWRKMERGRSELHFRCTHPPSLLCVKSNTYLNTYYVAKVYYCYLETNVTFFFASIKEFDLLLLMKLQMFAKMPWPCWATLPKYSLLRCI